MASTKRYRLEDRGDSIWITDDTEREYVFRLSPLSRELAYELLANLNRPTRNGSTRREVFSESSQEPATTG